MIKCRECGSLYEPMTDAYKCPGCGTENYQDDEMPPEPPPDRNLYCDQCGKPQWDDGSGLCSWRAGTEYGGCDGRQHRAHGEGQP